MEKWNTIPNNEIIKKTAQALSQNGFEVSIVENSEEAKQKVLEIVPEGSEVMVMTSETLRTLGLEEYFSGSGKYDAVKNKLATMPDTVGREKKKLGAAAAVSIGSVHAITHDGKVLIASNTGSQLPGYVYGSDSVVWVVGAQKIVADFNEGMERLEKYVVPLETERARKAYGLPETFHTFISKLLVYNREVTPNRVKIVLVKEVLGF